MKVVTFTEARNKLIKATKSMPFEGIGKPEPLKENLSGFWSHPCQLKPQSLSTSGRSPTWRIQFIRDNQGFNKEVGDLE